MNIPETTKWKVKLTDDRGGFEVDSPEYLDWRAFTTKDGCFELLRFYNGTTEDAGQIHVCDIDDLITRLTEMREVMKATGYYSA